jgi:phenylalanyl-tRNA synthetase beta chain
LENVLTRLYGLNVVWENQPVNWADSEKFSGVIKLEDGTLLGHMGIVKNSILKAYDLRGPVFAAEFDIDSMPLMKQRQPQFPLRFPLSWRDFSVVMPTNEPVSKLSVLFEGEPLVRNWQVVDLYRGEKLSPSEKSVTVRMWLGSDERTITNEEVDQVAQRVVERLEKAGWHLRA